MTEIAFALTELLDDFAWLALVVFLRIGAAMALLPTFGSHALPARIKLALALTFTAIVAPAVATRLDLPPPDMTSLVRVIAAESVIGLLLGFSVRLFAWLLQVAGGIAAQSTSLSQLLGAESVDPQPAIAQLLLVAGGALAVIAGFHVRVAEALILSYDTLPVGRFPLAADLSIWAVSRVGDMFATAFTFSGPFIIGSLIYNVALGVINKAMPQLMVAFVGAPAITAGGLLLLLLVAPIILPLWLGALNGQLSDPFGLPK